MSANSKVPVEQVFDSRLGGLDRDKPTFFIDAIDDAVGMQILWINVPFVFYAFDELNNYMEIYIESDVTSADRFETGMADAWVKLTFRPGTYSPDTFQMEFRRAITEAGIFKAQYAGDIVSKFFAMVNVPDGKLTIYHTSELGFEFGVRVANAEMADMLGFAANRIVWSSIGSVWRNGAPVSAQSNTRHVTGENTVKLIGQQRLTLHGTLSGQQSGSSRINDDSAGDSIISFPITNNVGTYLFYQPNQVVVPIDRTSMTRLQFYLTQGDRRQYVKRLPIPESGIGVPDPDPQLSIVNYLPLNGEGFQVGIRFITDNGVAPMRTD